jgi:hypothetical protein
VPVKRLRTAASPSFLRYHTENQNNLNDGYTIKNEATLPYHQNSDNIPQNSSYNQRGSKDRDQMGLVQGGDGKRGTTPRGDSQVHIPLVGLFIYIIIYPSLAGHTFFVWRIVFCIPYVVIIFN